MLIHKIPVGPLQTNCYIISIGSATSNSCVVIDPGDEAQKIIELVESKNLKPVGVVLTHDHFDHIEALDDVVKYFNVPIIDTKKENKIKIGEGEGESELKIIKTPGHSRDSVCFVSEKEKIIFSGDTLFNQGIGRTDLEGGDYEQIKKSLKLLMTYSDNYKVYPGHGSETTIGDEKQNNQYLHFS